MSITEDYEEYRKQIGSKKYEAIDEYIQLFGKPKEWEKGIKEIRKIEDTQEWERQNTELHKRCKPVFIEDVVLNPEEWEKFEYWYEEKNTYIIKVWENDDLREQGLSDILEVGIKDLKKAIARAKKLFENNDYVSIEVQTGDEQDTMYFKDKKEEKYYNLEGNSNEKEDELDEPESN